MSTINEKLLTDFSDKFLGYGNIKAPVWFIGMEPGSPDDIVLLENFFKVWLDRKKPAVDDVKKSHLQIGKQHYTKFFEDPVKYESTWGGLIKILFASQGKKDFNKEEVKIYQKEKLGRLDSDHCLLELFALPAKNNKSPYYDKYYKKHLKITKKDFFEKNINNRVLKFKKLIENNKPKIVVFYGTSYKKYWEEIVGCRMDIYKLIENKKIFYKVSNRTKFIICDHPVAFGITNKYFAEVGKLAASQ